MTTCLLGILTLVAAVACSPFDRTTPTVHRTVYAYMDFGAFPTGDQHPGARLTFQWTPRAEEADVGPEPDRVRLSVRLVGPFDTVDALKQTLADYPARDGTFPDVAGTTVIAAPDIETDSWSGQEYASLIELPPTIAPGYYSIVRQVVETSDRGTTRASAQGIIRVVAP